MEQSALLVIDMQNRFRSMAVDIVQNVVQLVEYFRQNGGHLVFTQHHDVPGSSSKLLSWWNEPIIKGSDDWRLLDELTPLVDLKKDILLVDKTRYDAFLFTTLDEELKKRHVNRVFIVGCMTNLCCETTARAAFMRDYNVVFVEDANGTSSAKMQKATVLNLGFGFAKIVKTDDVLKGF